MVVTDLVGWVAVGVPCDVDAEAVGPWEMDCEFVEDCDPDLVFFDCDAETEGVPKEKVSLRVGVAEVEVEADGAGLRVVVTLGDGDDEAETVSAIEAVSERLCEGVGGGINDFEDDGESELL